MESDKGQHTKKADETVAWAQAKYRAPLTKRFIAGRPCSLGVSAVVVNELKPRPRRLGT